MDTPRFRDPQTRLDAATLRERGLGDRPGLTLAARLPAWMTMAKHRDEVLRTIAKLRATLS